MITFVRGGAGSGKSTRIAGQMVEDLRRGLTPILIVPEQQAVEAEQLLADLTDRADVPTVSLEVLNFSRLANRIFRQFGGLSLRPVEKGARMLIMWRALADLAPALKEYKTVSVTDRSVLRLLLDTVTEFTRYKVTPAMLEECARQLEADPASGGVFSALCDKLSDLAAISAAYTTLLRADYDDPEETLTRACRLLERENFFGGKRVYLDSFTSFTPRQLDMIERIMLQADQLTIALGCRRGEDSPHAESIRHTEQILRRMAANHRLTVEEDVCLEDFLRSPHADLRHLEKYLWANDPPAGEDAPHIHLLECGDRFDEAEYAARTILRRVREGGHFYEHLIVVRDVDSWRGIADAVLEKYGIPCFLSARSALSARPEVKLLLTALAIAAGHWRLDDVIAHIKTGCTAISAGECDLLERYASTWKISGRRWTDPQDWAMNPDGYTDTLTEEGAAILAGVNDIRRRLTAPLIALENAFIGGCTLRQGGESVWRFLCETGLPARLEAQGPQGIQLWNVLVDALDQLVAVAPDSVVNAADFARLITVIFDETDMGSIPTAIDQVTVGSAMLLRAGRVRHVYLLGANADVFPARVSDDGIFCDQDKVTLETMGIVLSPMTDNRQADELLYFYRAVTAAADSVSVSWCSAEPGGRALLPSEGVGRIRRLFPGLPVRRFAELDPLDTLEGKEASFEAYARLRGTPLGEVLGEIYREDPAYARRLAALDQPFVREENLLSRELADELFGRNLTLTQAKIDAYSLCEFSYYCKYVLKLTESKPAEFRGVSTGSFVHRILERFIGAAMENGRLRTDLTEEEIARMVEEIITDYVRTVVRDEKQRTNRMMQLIGRLRRTSLLLIHNLLEEFAQSDFVPAYFELPIEFDSPDGIRPYRIPLPDGTTACITGKIDRLDLFRRGEDAYVRVVDYKTGVQDFSLTDLQLGLNLQMLLYLFAVWQNPSPDLREKAGGRGEILPAGVLYFSARTPTVDLTGPQPDEEVRELAGRELTRRGLLLRDEEVLRAMEKQLAGRYIPVTLKKDGDFSAAAPLKTLEEFGSLMREITDVVAKIAGRMKSGRADARPLKTPRHDGCRFCPMKAVCRIEKE